MKPDLQVLDGGAIPPHLLTRDEAASLLGVTGNTVYNWILDGRLTAEVTESGKRLIPESELGRILADRDSLKSKDWIPLILASRILGVSRQTLYNYCASGRLRKKVVSGRTFVARKSLQSYVEEIVTAALEKQSRLNNLFNC